MTVEPETIHFLLGSNLGNPIENLKLCIERIEKRVGLLVKKSSVYQTAAWGKPDQPDFLNQVVQVKTILSPSQVLEIIVSIESDLGRQRNKKWDARTIDIDILYFGNQIINSPNLLVPHASLHLRKFALVPLVELAPDFIHPIFKKSNRVLLEECNDTLTVKLVSNL